MNTQDFRFTDYKDDDAVRLTQKLVQTESTDPGIYETPIARFICELLKESGVSVHTEEVQPGRFNILAEIRGTDVIAPALVFICHMDTVVIGTGWTYPPLTGLEKNGRIYGRGSCDMKSGLACALTLFLGAARKVKSIKPEHTLRFISTVDEEDFMRGAEKVVSSEWVSKQDYILDMEPTDSNIENSHKGRIWFEIEIRGCTAHASMPEKGADAVAAAAEVISSIRKCITSLPADPHMGKTTVTFGQIAGGYRPYVVPDEAKVWIDIRTAPPVTNRMIENLIQQSISNGCKKIPGTKGSYRITGDRPWISPHNESPLLKMLSASVYRVTGKKSNITLFPGYTDTAVIASRTGNSNCLSYGPGKLELAHKPDEYVDISDIRRVHAVLADLIKTYIFTSEDSGD